VVWPEPAAPGGRREPSGTPPPAVADDAPARDAAAARGTVADRLRAQAAEAGSPDDAVDPGDVDLDGHDLSTTELLAREFGAEVIEERPRVD